MNSACGRGQLPVPLDMDLFRQWLEAYRADPAQCVGPEWVDPGFAADWFEGSQKRDLSQAVLPVPLSVMQLGDVGFVFHPAELYSCYGLTIRRDSPLPDTLVVGYSRWHHRLSSRPVCVPDAGVRGHNRPEDSGSATLPAERGPRTDDCGQRMLRQL